MEKDDAGKFHSVVYNYDESYVALFWNMPELNHTFVVAHWSPLIPDEGLKEHTRYERIYHRPADLRLAWRHGWNVRIHATAPKHEIDAYAECKAKR